MPETKTVRSHLIDSPVLYLKGCGPVRAEILRKELDIVTCDDLLHHYPFRYVDRTRIYTISEVSEALPYIQLKGKIKNVSSIGQKRAVRIIAQLADETGTIDLVWFRSIMWVRNNIKAGTEYLVFGKPSMFNGKFNIIHPEMELLTDQQPEGFNKMLQPFYSTTEISKSKGLDSRYIMRLQKTLIEILSGAEWDETLPASVREEFRLVPLKDAFSHIHFPPNAEKLKQAQLRLKFEEFFFLQLRLLKMKKLRSEKIKGIVFSKVGEWFNAFYKNHLPFELTQAQKKVLREMRDDMRSGNQMNRLLQGDVGSGKTLVALLCMLLAADNGYQSCLMAPTEILARQHGETISSLIAPLHIKTAVLTGSTKPAERNEIINGIKEGSIRILIGTHALIEETVQLQNPGLVIIDEQHRFGVEQRARLWNRHGIEPHVLVMTATPIPRTLAMTFYGDLDVSVIDELPPGRKPVKTSVVNENQRLRLNGFLKEQIKAGRQVYVVYPLIEESEKLDLSNLQQGYEAICRDFPAPEFRTSIVHGKMNARDRDAEMKRFAQGKTQLMVATTVIEVGVNIPNASVMVIESAERFGLSQLHQLRGRVGRGADQSFCILVAGTKISNEARQRLQALARTNDGFEIAEMDLKLRGPGDLHGTRQSGIANLKIADIARDAALLETARTAAQKILAQDPTLGQPGNYCLVRQLKALEKKSGNWWRVS